VRLLRSPLAQFLLAGAVVVVVVFVATGRLSGSAASTEAIDDAIATTRLLARSVAEPEMPRGLVDGDAAAIDRFDRAVLRRLLVGDVQRIKIWDEDGTVVYSDATRLIGERFDLGADEWTVLTHGGEDAEESDLSEPENRFEQGHGGLLEVYTRIESPEGQPLLFEVYYSAADIEARRAAVLAAFRPITLGGIAALALAAVPLLWVLTRRLDRAARERERLLRAAVDASDAERRRIARDLHDTVVQDLAGTAFSLSAAAQAGGAPPEELARLGGSVRGSLRGLRSLLVEIHPPDLTTSGLHAALEDLVAGGDTRDVRAEVATGDLSGLDDRGAALVWRVAQEAVRNALRHADASRIGVRVEREGAVTVLEVTDDGRGFDPAAVARPGADGSHFGLRGLESLVRDAGGRIRVRSAPGAGTSVRMELS
jgi:two-component system NarL family sensor kinase